MRPFETTLERPPVAAVPAEPSLTPSRPAPPGVRDWLLVPWRALAVAVGLTYWVVVGLLVSVISWPLYLVLPRRLGRPVGGALLRLVLGVFVAYVRATGLVKADVSSLAPLRRDLRPCILAPNHLALWDAVFLVAALPRVVCVMKAPIIRNPLLGGGACLAGFIPAGDNRRMIRGAAAALREGCRLVLFPEGTRTRPEARWINPLRGGVALIAARAGVPVHPVFIRSSSRFLEKGWRPWRRPGFPVRVELELGAPVAPAASEPPQQFVARLQQVFEAELARPHPLRRASGA